MSYEHQFVTSVIDNESISSFVHAVKPVVFFSLETKLAWGELVKYFLKYKKSPPRTYVVKMVPSFQFMASNIDAGALLQFINSSYVKNKLQEKLESLSLESDIIEEPLSMLTGIISELEEVSRNVVSEEQVLREGEDVTDVIRRYRGELSDGAHEALPFPWEPLQRATYGASPSSYNLLIARMKNHKTWILLLISVIWSISFDRKCVIFTKELTKERMWDRIICILAGIEWSRFMSKELTQLEEDEFEHLGYEIKHKGLIYIEKIGDFSGKEAVREIARVCRYHGMQQGDILAVDGLYFYSNNDVFTMRTFSQALRQLLLNMKYIGIFTTQANSNFEMSLDVDPGKITNLGDACTQDCTTGISMEFNEAEKELTMATIAVRDGLKQMWVINAEPCKDFTLKFSNDPEKNENKVTIPNKEMLDRVLRMLGQQRSNEAQ